MFQPDDFRVTDRVVIADAAQRIQFACIVTFSDGQLHATHAPCVVKHDGDAITVEFHVARGNPHWKHAEGGPTLAVFQGEQAYVHPGWYPTKAETGKAVPTWNYVTVHLHGTLERMDAGEDLHRHLEELTALNEAGRPEPWAMSDAPDRYIETMKRGLVGLRLRVAEAQGALKLSQNKNEDDHRGALQGLKTDGDAAAAVAALMADAQAREPMGDKM